MILIRRFACKINIFHARIIKADFNFCMCYFSGDNAQPAFRVHLKKIILKLSLHEIVLIEPKKSYLSTGNMYDLFVPAAWNFDMVNNYKW